MVVIQLSWGQEQTSWFTSLFTHQQKKCQKKQMKDKISKHLNLLNRWSQLTLKVFPTAITFCDSLHIVSVFHKLKKNIHLIFLNKWSKLHTFAQSLSLLFSMYPLMDKLDITPSLCTFSPYTGCEESLCVVLCCLLAALVLNCVRDLQYLTNANTYSYFKLKQQPIDIGPNNVKIWRHFSV